MSAGVQWIANVMVVGLLVWGLAQLVLMGRFARIVDRASEDARYWRLQAQRDAAAAQQMRRQFLPDPPPLRQGPIDPNPRQRFDPPTVPGPDPRVTVTRAPAPVPPLAQQTGETLVLPRTVVSGDEEPQSRPIGTRSRSRRTAEAADA